jgi:hypothetical protein
MDKNKVADLAKSFSLSCKQVVKSNQLAQGLTSPAIMLVALTVLKIMVNDVGIDKQPAWAG